LTTAAKMVISTNSCVDKEDGEKLFIVKQKKVDSEKTFKKLQILKGG
jgi:hypothetical protein